MSTLADELEKRKAAIAEKAMTEMYQDPFWEARFGERGRKHSREDGLYHLQYLRQAVLAQDVSLLVNYARWLRGVLVPRGMCSAHLADNLSRIGRIVVEEKLPDAEQGRVMLEEAVRALDYADDDLARLSQVPRELRTLASYLADAIAAGDPSLFARHVQWARGSQPGVARQLAELEPLAPEGRLRNAVRAARGSP